MQSYPFTSRVTYDEHGNPLYDRAVNANFLRDYYKKDRCNGVIALGDSTAFQVVSNQGMTVKVKPGYCFINGAYGYEDEIREMQVQAADSLDRIDTVVLRLNDDVDVRAIDLYVVKGTPATIPTQPTLTRSSSVYELGLANLYIPAGSSAITQERITDTRANTNRCGYSIPLQEIDTQHIYDQVQSDLAGFKTNEEEDFVEWFDRMKDQLSEDAAGHLQNEIDDVYKVMGYNGAKNLIDATKNWTPIKSTVIVTDTSINVKTTTAQTWSQVNQAFKIIPNTNYTFTTDATYISGFGYIEIHSSPNGTTAGTVLATTDFTSSQSISLSVNADSNPYIVICLCCTKGTAMTGEVTYNNVMLRYNEDTDTTYQPYAMTNKELTPLVENVAVRTSYVATSGQTLESALSSWCDANKGDIAKHHLIADILAGGVSYTVYIGTLNTNGYTVGIVAVNNSTNDVYVGKRAGGSNAVLTQLTPKYRFDTVSAANTYFATSGQTLEQAIASWCDTYKPTSDYIRNVIGTVVFNNIGYGINVYILYSTGQMEGGILRQYTTNKTWSTRRATGSNAVLTEMASQDWVNEHYMTQIGIPGVAWESIGMGTFAGYDGMVVANKGVNSQTGQYQQVNTTWSCSIWSDERIKTNVKPSQVNALDVINNLEPKEFDFVDEKYGKHTDLGFIAQNIEKYIPNAILEAPQNLDTENGIASNYIKTLAYERIVPYLIKAIQEQQEEIEKLKSIIKKED